MENASILDETINSYTSFFNELESLSTLKLELIENLKPYKS